MNNRHCHLCSKVCVLEYSPEEDMFFTKNCQFVSYLMFDTKTSGWVNTCGTKQSFAIFSDILDRKEEEKVCYLNNAACRKTPKGGIKTAFVSELLANMPKQGSEMHIVQIRNLRRIHPKGQFSIDYRDKGLCHALLIEKNDVQSIKNEIDVLCEYGYLSKINSNPCRVIITQEGFKAEPVTSKSISNTAFIALAFDKNEELLNIIRQTIRSCGFTPIDMIDHQHNNYIMDEILKQIDDCKFLICDVTKPNNGAYFEAGYAMGRGHDVILTCSKESFDNGYLHFDLRQYKAEVWNDYDDLRKKLKERIQKTILVKK